MTTMIRPASTSDHTLIGRIAAQGKRSLSPRSLFATSDHILIGRMFIVLSLLCAFATAVLGVLLRIEHIAHLFRLRADHYSFMVFDDPNNWFRMWTLYRMSFIFLVLLPLLIGLGMTIIPSQIGANALAFPRAALGAFWCWLIGATIMVVSVLGGGGWGSLYHVTPDNTDAVSLTLLGTGMTICGLLLAALVMATTIISLRETGMSLKSVPPFTWSMLVASVVWLTTFPIVIANIALIYTGLRGGQVTSFAVSEDKNIWLQLDWIAEPPAVYALAIPALGIILELLYAASGRKAPWPTFGTIAVGLFGFLSIGGWLQDFFAAGNLTADGTPVASDPRYQLPYVVFAMAIMLLVFAFSANMFSLPRVKNTRTASLTLMLVAATVFGALRVLEPFELLESTMTTSVFNALAVAVIIVAVAGICHWSYQLFGVTLVPEKMNQIILILLLTGGLCLTGADALSGLLGADSFVLLPEVALDVESPLSSQVEAQHVSSAFVQTFDTGSIAAFLKFASFLGLSFVAAGLLMLSIEALTTFGRTPQQVTAHTPPQEMASTT